MNKKKSLLIAALALVVAGVTLGSTLAFFTDTKSQENTFTMGNVSIELTEEEFAKNTNNTYEITKVIPGKEIVKDPTITVGATSEDSYLRAEITYTGLTDEEITELEKGIALNEGWVKGTDGKYYFNQIVKAGSVNEIFHTVTIPEGWDNDSVAGGKFTMNVKAEAVQADNLSVVKDGNNIINWTDSNGGAIEVK